jgi:hypothetical protein
MNILYKTNKPVVMLDQHSKVIISTKSKIMNGK